MYLDHFNFKREPFGMAPDPEFLWLGHQHGRVFETLREGVFERDGCVILTGDVGTGKTVLVKRMLRQDRVAAVFITVSGPKMKELDFYHVLAAEFHLKSRFESREEFIAAFSRILARKYGSYRKVILIIDEAQRLTPEALQDLFVLADRQSNGTKRLKILLVGQLDFNAAAVLEINGGALPNIAARCRLEPMTEASTKAYIEHRLKAAGREQPLFSAGAVHEIHALSKGFPRLINIICDHALLYGYSGNLAEIDGGLIRDCSRDLSVALGMEEAPDDPRPPSAAGSDVRPAAAQTTGSPAGGWRSLLYLAAAVLTAGAVVYLLTR